MNDHVPAGTQPARVIRHDGATMLGRTTTGDRTLLPSWRLEPAPTVGDWVAIPDEQSGDGPTPVAAVLPRHSLLARQSADELSEQALAANVDIVLIVCGVDRPLKPGRVQRVATQAWDGGATPVLLLTKAVDPDAVDLPRLELEHAGMEVLTCAALERIGLESVCDRIAGLTTVLIGESGAGKSTLANALLGQDAARIGRVRTGDAKGRHTTTARHLHLLPGPAGGSIIDTPGIRSVGLAADPDSVAAVFPEIEELSAGCRFGDCAHTGEPGCAVQQALDDGSLARERYDGWRRLQRELASAALRSSPRHARAYYRQFGRRVKEAQSQVRR